MDAPPLAAVRTFVVVVVVVGGVEVFCDETKRHYDLAVAGHIQRSLLPRNTPETAGYEIVGWSQPAQETALGKAMLETGFVVSYKGLTRR